MLLVMLALTGAATPASAATVSSAAGNLVFEARPAEENLVSISASALAYRVVDYGAALTPGSGCLTGRWHIVVCDRPAGGSVTVHVGDGSDSAVLRDVADPAIIDGGPGDDLLVGGNAADMLSGGPGRDTLQGSDGADVLSGGDDQDFLAGDVGDDSLSGGGASDELNGGAGDDELIGGDGANVLDGGDGADRLYGGADADTLTGGPAQDTLYGGPGVDALNGIDDVADLIDCGGDADAVHSDELDQLVACLPPPRMTPPAIGAPTVKLGVRIQFVRRRLLRVLVPAASAADVRVTLAFRDRNGRSIGRRAAVVRTNRWNSLKRLLPRKARKVRATCCR